MPPLRRSGQVAQLRTLRFAVPSGANTDRLDDWLGRVVEIDLKDPLAGEHADPATDGTSAAMARHWLGRCLLLASTLLQTGRVPVFDGGDIVACEADGHGAPGWKARVRLVVVDHLPPPVHELAIRGALQLCAWATARPPSDENIAQFFHLVDKHVLSRLQSTLPGAKSTLPVLRVARQRGLPSIHLGGGVFQLGWGSRARRLDRSTTEFDTAIGARLAQNKLLTASLLRIAGLPAPRHAVAANEAAALDAARRLAWPVVVKPVDRDRGEGVTVDVADEAALAAAFAFALALSKTRQVIVERQVPGVCHRLFIAHGRLLYAVKRLPMSVQADGLRSVRELVDAEVRRQRNRAPWRRSEIQPLDDMAHAAMHSAGWSPDSVPPSGTWVPLRRIESTAWGGVDEEVTHSVHPHNLAIALRAAQLFGLHVAGIDIITQDIAQSWQDGPTIINEVNFAPLLGGGEISRRHIPMFLDHLLAGDGRIPVEAYAGGDAAITRARARARELQAQGLRCYVTTADATFAADGDDLMLTFNSLYRRVRALLIDPGVDAIVAVVQTDEFLDTSLPVDGFDKVTRVDDELTAHRGEGERLGAQRAERLWGRLASGVWL